MDDGSEEEGTAVTSPGRTEEMGQGHRADQSPQVQKHRDNAKTYTRLHGENLRSQFLDVLDLIFEAGLQ